jgi:hypothetical protein
MEYSQIILNSILKQVQDDIAICHAELVAAGGNDEAVSASIDANNIISASYIMVNFINYSGYKFIRQTFFDHFPLTHASRGCYILMR